MFNRALIVLLGFGIAGLFGVSTSVWYGADNLSEFSWIQPVFLALASSGVVFLVILDGCHWVRRLWSGVRQAVPTRLAEAESVNPDTRAGN